MCTVTFVLGRTEIQVDSSKLQSSTEFFSKYVKPSSLSPSPITSVRVLLPDWLKPKTLQAYLTYLSTSRPTTQDTVETMETMELAALLEDQSCEERLLQSDCFVSISRNCALTVVTTAGKYRERSPAWRALYTKAFELASEHLHYMLDKWKGQLAGVPAREAERLYRASLRKNHARVNITEDGVIKGLKEVLGVTSVVDLLLLEEKRCLEVPLKTPHMCRIDVAKGELSVSQSFILDALMFELAWRVSPETCTVEFSIVQINEPLLTICVSLQVVVSMEGLPEPLVDTRLVDVFQGASEIQSLSVPTLTSSLRISSQIRAEFVLSAVTKNIATHLDEPLVTDRLIELSSAQLLSVLKSPALRVASEDSILYILGRWTEAKTGKLDCVKQFLNVVCWENVSLMCLMDCSRRFRRLKSHPDFNCILRKEFAYRSGTTVPRPLSAHTPKHIYKSAIAHSHNSYFSFLSDVANILPELDFTPKSMPEGDPAHNRALKQMQEKQVLVEKLRTHYNALQLFHRTESQISVVPCTTTKLKEDAACKPSIRPRKSSMISVEETQRIPLKAFLTVSHPAPAAEATTSTDRE